MPCLPRLEHGSLHVLSRQSPPPLDQPGLGWQTILAFTSILFAGLQGTLAMESGDPCRISFAKVCLLLFLELMEIIVVLAAEVFSFVDLRAALQIRLQWLHWLPYCLLVYGIMGLVIDVVFTLYLANRSRVKWIPFSNMHDYENLYTRLISMINLVVTTGLSLVLVGWRQRWWLKTSSAVSPEVAIGATTQERSLSVAVMTFCLSWSLVLLTAAMVACVFFRDVLRNIISGLKLTLANRRKHSRSHEKKPANIESRENTLDDPTIEEPRSPDDEKDVGCNVFFFFERLLYPNKYKSPISNEETPELENRCRLLMLLHTYNSIEKKESSGKSFFEVQIENSERHARNEKKADICTEKGDDDTTNHDSSSLQSSYIDVENGSDTKERSTRIMVDSRDITEASVEDTSNGEENDVCHPPDPTSALSQDRDRCSVRAVQQREKYVDHIQNCTELDEVVSTYLKRSKLHIRNAIVPDGIDAPSRANGDEKSTVFHIVLLMAEHGSLLPLLICVVVAVGRLWDKLDPDSFRAIKELSDAVIVVSMVEIAVTLKYILWGRNSTHEADIQKFERSSKL